MTTPRYKCRYCDYSVLSFYTNKHREIKSGWARLRNHIEDCHPDEFDKMQAQLDEMDAGRQLDRPE